MWNGVRELKREWEVPGTEREGEREEGDICYAVRRSIAPASFSCRARQGSVSANAERQGNRCRRRDER